MKIPTIKFKKLMSIIFNRKDEKTYKNTTKIDNEINYLNFSLNHANPTLCHHRWFELNQKKCIMICHDQKIDRRIIQQAISLEKIGVKTLIVSLSFDEEDALDTQDNILIHRVGTNKIIPNCPAFLFHKRIQLTLYNFKFLHKEILRFFHIINNVLYKITKLLIYRCNVINHPLPFNECFYRAASLYKDACFVMAHDLPSLKAAGDIAEKFNVPLLYDAHELYPDQNVFSSYQKKIMYKTEALYIKKCDLVFTVCDSIAEIMKKRYKIKKPSVIFNALPYYTFPDSTSPMAINFLKNTNQFILFQGGLFKHRNIENLIRGFLLTKNHNVKLVFLGPKDKNFEKTLKNIAGKKFNETILFLDPVPQDKLLEITKKAIFGVIPYTAHDTNTKYCLPNKLFEFIQAELPFLYHNQLLEVSKISKQLDGAAIGISFLTPESIKDGIEMMMTNNLAEFRNKLQNLKNLFCWENEEVKLLNLIKKIVHPL